MKALLSLVTRPLRAWAVNYKTTLAGITLVAHGAVAVLDHVNAITQGNADLSPDALQLAVGEILAGAGLIAARDADRSSQQSGVRKEVGK